MTALVIHSLDGEPQIVEVPPASAVAGMPVAPSFREGLDRAVEALSDAVPGADDVSIKLTSDGQGGFDLSMRAYRRERGR